LVATLDREAADREAHRLADGHKFDLDGGVALQNLGRYFFTVTWLEPAQVAALRCESTVVEIDVGEEIQITSGGRY
jgi:hypothetical protein